jgi:glucan phosphoethanolaminetransferase (alkaline phosphatase superfamily)
MSLKLFRSTGYSSILAPGETRRATKHPGWVVLAVSLWAGFACNVALWRALESGESLLHALVLGAFVASACAAVLSLLGWRKTLKPAATLLLFLAALSACAIWGQSLPLDGRLADMRLSTLMIPPWASLLRWQVSLLLVSLAVVPTMWVWNAQLRRLAGPDQLSVNVTGMLMALAALAASGFLLFRGLV